LTKLLNESNEIDIEIPAELFDRGNLMIELANFSEWRKKTEDTLKQLEKELNYDDMVTVTKSDGIIQNETMLRF
jgi:hypothetical protein